MRTPLLCLAALSLSLVACSKGFGSNFEGSIVLHHTRPGMPPADMTVRAKGDKLRFETPLSDGQTAVAIFLPSDNKLVVVMDAQKTAMDMDLSAGGAAPNTSATSSDVQKTGKKETIAGIDCEDYVVKDPGGRRTETCIAEGLAFFDLESVRRPGGGSTWSRDMRAKKMFPLKSVDYDSKGTEVDRSEVTSIKKEKLADTLFQVPEGYTRTTQPHYGR